jgi:hypothetical protein
MNLDTLVAWSRGIVSACHRGDCREIESRRGIGWVALYEKTWANSCRSDVCCSFASHLRNKAGLKCRDLKSIKLYSDACIETMRRCFSDCLPEDFKWKKCRPKSPLHSWTVGRKMSKTFFRLCITINHYVQLFFSFYFHVSFPFLVFWEILLLNEKNSISMVFWKNILYVIFNFQYYIKEHLKKRP